MMLSDIQKYTESNMDKSIESLKSDFAKVRTGRANPALLEHIRVPYYGNDVPLNQVSSIVVSDARTLAVTPWEKNMIAPIEKAIMQSDLGLNPATHGNVIRIPMPGLSEERRKELSKFVHQLAEETRVAVRNIRRDANNKIKTLLKNKDISEDELRRGENNIQKLTDKFIKKIDELLAQKASDLMKI